MLSAEEITRILDHTTNLKHWVMIATFYATGLRCKELRNLKTRDFDSQRMVIIPIESRPASLKSSYRKCFDGNRYVMPDRLGAEALPIKPKDFGLALSSNRADNSGYAVARPESIETSPALRFGPR